jgi:hypothetical protein
MSHKKAKLLRKLQNSGRIDVNVETVVKSSSRISRMTSSMTVVDSIDDLSDEQRDIFFPALEELTPELEDELRATGWANEALEYARQMGWEYNRKRNSFMGNSETIEGG